MTPQHEGTTCAVFQRKRNPAIQLGVAEDAVLAEAIMACSCGATPTTR